MVAKQLSTDQPADHNEPSAILERYQMGRMVCRGRRAETCGGICMIEYRL